MEICTEKMRWPAQPCPVLQNIGREKLKGLPKDLSRLIRKNDRTGEFHISLKQCMQLPKQQRLQVLETAFLLSNNKLGLFNKCFLDLDFETQDKLLTDLNEPPKHLMPIPVMMIQIPHAHSSYIGQLIGKKGNNINMLKEKTGAAIDVNNLGQVIVSGRDRKTVNYAASAIKMFLFGPECGKIYNGKISKVADFGLFVELSPGIEGLLHISRMAAKEHPIVGDEILVKVIEIRQMPGFSRPMVSLSSKITEEEFNRAGEE